ncbi:MAG: hypothetical protein ACXWZ3_04270 [Solirubrobacterales bacterium]
MPNSPANATKSKVTPLPKERRLRYGKLPVPDPRADLYWGVNQPELQGLTNGQLAKLLMTSADFKAVIGPKLKQIDQRSRTGWGKNQGRPIRWTSEQLEAVLVYRRVSGLSTVKRTRERLHFDREAQSILGFDQGIPSEATMTRYLTKHFDPDERAELYRELDRRLRQRVTELPDFDQETRKLGLDGSQHPTHYTPPIPEADQNGKLTGRIRNADFAKGQPGAITAPDAGLVGGDNPKSGRGWQFVGLFSEHGTLLGWDISALNLPERAAAERVLKTYEKEILPRRGNETVSVCTADGGFSSPTLRRQMQELRIVPNIHKASHGDAERSKRHAARRSNQWIPFNHPSKPHYKNWQANLHGELRCSCGQGATERIFNVGPTGNLGIATRGSCTTCGKVTITAGKWRRARDRLLRVLVCHPSLGASRSEVESFLGRPPSAGHWPKRIPRQGLACALRSRRRSSAPLRLSFLLDPA